MDDLTVEKETALIEYVSEKVAEKERESKISLAQWIILYCTYTKGYAELIAGLNWEFGRLALYVPLALLGAIIVSPLAVPYIILEYLITKKKVFQFRKKPLVYDFPVDKEISTIWKELVSGYFPYYDEDLSQVVCHLISILYPEEYHLDVAELERMFDKESAKQGAVYSKYAAQGLKVSQQNWREVVIDRVMSQLPNYG